VRGAQVLAPGPRHSRNDRSLSIKLIPGDKFIVYSFAGDDPIACRDYVRAALGLGPFRLHGTSYQKSPKRPQMQLGNDDGIRQRHALALWHEARNPHDTIVATYLRGRGLELPDDAGKVIRFHPRCPFNPGHFEPCMLALVRAIISDAPQAIQRTALNPDGTAQKSADGKTARLTYGPLRGGAIKLTADENLTLCLGVAEGVETALSMRLCEDFGPTPVWSLVSAGGFTWLPPLSGIETLWIGADNDPTGQQRAAELAKRWAEAGHEVLTITPRAAGADINDLAGRQR